MSEETSEENTGSIVNGRDDENLVQNWSLTFTEYNKYDDGRDKDSFTGGEVSEKWNGGEMSETLNGGDVPENQNGEISEKLDDGKVSEKLDGGEVSEKMDDGEILEKMDGGEVLEKIDCGEERDDANISSGTTTHSNKVTDAQEHKTGSAPERKNNGDLTGSGSLNREMSPDRNQHHPSEKLEIRSDTQDNVEESNTAGTTWRHKALSSTQLENDDSIQTDDPNVFSPTINEKAQTSVNVKKFPETTTAYSLGGGRSSKAPRNTPATANLGGKIQQVYVRFPGQRTGQMMFAEMNQQSGQVRIVGHDKEKEMLARLSWLLIDAGTSALRATFDSIHPPLSLRDHLEQPHVKTVIQKLLQQTALSDKQWKLLYPDKKNYTSSLHYDSRTLVILLETICHLCPPYPHGWANEPLPLDGSLSADIVRLQLLFLDIAARESIAGEAYIAWFVQIRNVIVRLGGPSIRTRIARIESEFINMDMQQHYIQTLRTTWQPDTVQTLEKVHAFRNKTSKSRKTYANSKGAEEGISIEERATLKKTSKVLVDIVQFEDVMDRLQQSQVLKLSDRQQILTNAKRQDRMKLLLDMIAESKLPYALKALFDALKFKYKKLYQHVMAVRKQIYKDGVVTTVDVAGITQEALCSHYKSRFSRLYPFPWSEGVHGTVRELYTPLYIVDNNGKKIADRELLPKRMTNGQGKRILLEGESGSGKSVLCAWLAYTWATNENYFRNRYQHLIYLNMSTLTGNLETALYKSLFPDSFKISLHEFWNMLEKNPGAVLFVIEGYERESDVDLTDILTGTRMKGCSVLLTSKPKDLPPSMFIPDTKWFNLGLNYSNIRRCFRRYVNMCGLDHEDFKKLYHLAGHESWPLRPHLASPMLANMAFGVFSVLKKGTMLRKMTTTCDLLEMYGIAVATHYCRQQNIDILGFEFPDEVLRAIKQLDRLAFKILVTGTKRFSQEDVLVETENPIVLKFGAFNKLTQGSRLQFTCGMTRHFLSARYIADMAYEDIETTVLTNKMIKLPKYTQLMSFLCGQYRDDTDTPVLQYLFDRLAARNQYCTRGFFLPATPIQSPRENKGRQEKITRGVIDDYATSLQCLAECDFRLDVIQTIAQSLPHRVIINVDRTIPIKSIQGLCLTLAQVDCTVQEMDLTLHQYHNSQRPQFLQFATSTGRCRSMKCLKITWSSLDIMSCYLETVMKNTANIESVILTEDISRKPQKRVSAATWSALQSACSNMHTVRHLSFVNGRVASVLYHVLQHIPTTISHLNLTGCAFNMMCAGQVGSYLHGNTNIRSIDLSNTGLNSSECCAIFQGLQICESIRSVHIRGAMMDRPCVTALGEYIKLTHGLETLDLSDCELNTEVCIRLANAIHQNRTLTKLVVLNANISFEGQKVISKTESRLAPVSVVGLLKYTS